MKRQWLVMLSVWCLASVHGPGAWAEVVDARGTMDDAGQWYETSTNPPSPR